MLRPTMPRRCSWPSSSDTALSLPQSTPSAGVGVVGGRASAPLVAGEAAACQQEEAVSLAEARLRAGGDRGDGLRVDLHRDKLAGDRAAVLVGHLQRVRAALRYLQRICGR